MRMLVRSLSALLLIIPLLACAEPPAPGFQEGVNYERLTPPQPTDSGANIEVMELFWYGCPHCFHLESMVAEWLRHKPANVTFIRVPAPLNDDWELLARAFYAAEDLGMLDKLHAPLFEAIHEQHTPMNKEDDVVAFFTAHGVAEDDIRNALSSFSVETKLRRAKLIAERSGISGVPAVIVNGKYRTNVTLAGSNENLFKVVDFLIGMESAKTAAP